MELSKIHAEWGKRIRRARRDKDIAAGVFAESVGISRTHLYRIEQGQQSPSDTVRLEIARVLELEPNELFSYELEPAEQ